MYGDEMREQNSLNSFKKSAESNSDLIESYHDNSSEDVDMDGNNLGLKITDQRVGFVKLIKCFNPRLHYHKSHE